MDLDFTLSKYNKLCEAISNSEYIPLTVEKYLSEPHPQKFIIIRHDVDTITENAFKMAQMENRHCLVSTYYFRSSVFAHPDILKRIVGLGHEVGYHYEVLDKAKGDYEKAIEIFKNELSKFRKIVDVKTICMHGNSLTPYDNRDLWKFYDFKEFDIIGEAYISIDFNKVIYFSDTSRRWDGIKYRLKDIVDVTNSYSTNLRHTDDIIRLIKRGEIDQLYILVHPARWSDSRGEWLKELVLQNIKNIGKRGLKWYKRRGDT